MFKGILRSLLGFILLPLFIFTVFLTAIYLTLTNPNFYKESLIESGLYEKSPQLISDGIAEVLTSQVRSSIENEFAKEVDVSQIESQFQPVIDSSVEKIITPDVIQTTAEENIDNVLNYFKEEEKNLTIYLPKSEIFDSLESQADGIISEIEGSIQSFPSCTPEQLDEFQNNLNSTVTVNCLPEEIKNNLSTGGKLDSLGDMDTFFAELKNQKPELTGANEITLKEFVQNSDIKKETSAEGVDLVNTVEKGRDGFKVITNIFYILWPVIIIGLMFYGLLSNGNLKNRSKSVFTYVFISNLVILVPATLAKIGLSSTSYADSFVEELNIDGTNGEIAESVIELARTFVTNLINPIFFITLGIASVSIIAIIMIRIMQRNDSNEKIVNPAIK